MRKKLLIGMLVLGVGFAGFVGCTKTGGNNGDKPNGGSSTNGPGSELVYEGEMLLNGFDSISDLYKIKQMDVADANGQTILTTSTNKARIDIVGTEDFLFSDSQATIDKVNAAINALPEASSITTPTNEMRSAASKARSLYTALTSSGKAQITNAEKLNAVIEALDMNGVYTLGELVKNSCKNDLTAGMKGVGSWQSACADLLDMKEGKIVFTAKGLCDNTGSMPNHALQMVLFHDSETNDGIYMRVATDDDTIYVGNKTKYNMALSAKLMKDCKYTFEVSYKVADDYSNVTLGIKILDDLDQIVCNQTQVISDFNASNTGEQTIKSWLTGERKFLRNGFFLDSGTTEGLTVEGLWKGYSLYNDEEYTGYNPSDLAPRQGVAALRVNYVDVEAYSYIYANFNASDLAGLPTKSLGGMSVKIFNDSAATKNVTFSIVRDYGNVFVPDGSTFELAPYSWTTCALSFDPNLIWAYNDIVGVGIEFENKHKSIYYVDDWKLSFDMVETPEQAAQAESMNQLRLDVSNLKMKGVTTSDSEMVKSIYERYNALSPVYKEYLGIEEQLNTVFQDYNQAVYEKDVADGKTEFSLLALDDYLGLTRISGGASLPEYASYTTDVKAPGGNGSLKLDLSNTDVVNGIEISLADAIYDELHVWVKNDSTTSRYFRLSNQMLRYYNGTAYDEQGNEILGEYINGNNVVESKDVYDGWIRLVYRNYVLVKNIITAPGDGSLYIGGIYGVSNQKKVTEAIAALDAYTTGYTAEQKQKVKEVRAMYDALGDLTKDRISGKSKLFEIQAKIWLEDYNALNLPDNVNNVEYQESLQTKVNVLADDYLALEESGRKLIKTQYEKLASLQKRFDTMSDQIRETYTLKDFGAEESQLNMWLTTQYKIPAKRDGAAMFTITHRAISGTGVFYITLFHEANVAAGSTGLGIAYTFQTFEARCNGKSVSFSQSMVADVPYLISISYDTADDGSSITTVLTVERADTGERLGQLTNTFTEINGKSGKTLTEWIDGHYKLFINSGQCDIDRIGNAWNHLSYAKLQEVKRIEAAIQSPDVESLEELSALNEDYEALPQIYRLMVKGIEVFNSKFDVAVKVLRDGAYTLSELGGTDGTIGSWGSQVLTMKDNMEGTFIYKMTKTASSGNHIHSFTLFYDGAGAGNGVRLTFQINNNLTINGTTVSMENVQPNVEYYYLISWKVSEDYSKVTVRIRVEATDGTSVLGDQTMELTSLIGAESIEAWVKANNKILIDAQQCSFSVASAWTEFDLEKFTIVRNWKETVANLTGKETYEELIELKETYENLPREYQLLMDYATLEKAINKIEPSNRNHTYTLSELGGKDGAIGSWGSQVLTMKDNMEGTFIYKMTKTASSGNHIHSFTLFYDGAGAGNGVRLTFQINNNLTINGTTVSMENVQPNVEYYYLISWKVSEDYSKVTVRIRVEATDGTSVLGDQTMELTSLIGAESIEAWVKANNKILIDAQQCSFSVASAWTEFDDAKFEAVQNLKKAISELTGLESTETLNTLKSQYDAMDRVYQLMVDNYSTLQQLLGG